MTDPVEFDPAARALLAELLNARARIAEWEQIKTDLEERLKALIDDAPVATIDGRPVVQWATVTSRVLDQARLKAEHPELAAQYLVQRQTRPFRLLEGNLGGRS